MSDQELNRAAILERQNEHDRLRSTILGRVATVIGGLCILATLTVAVFIIRDKASNDRTNGDRISDLTVELRKARDLIAATDAAAKAENDCMQTFAGAIAVRLSDYLATLGDLIVVVATPDGDDKRALIDKTVTRLRDDLAEYRAIVKDRNAWADTGSPLPCPIETGG